MSGVNKVIVIGRLGSNPEIKELASGNKVSTFSVATSETWKDKKSGEKQEKTEWHRIVTWDKTAENCVKFLTKGKLVYIEGALQTRTYDKDGQKHYATEIKAQNVQFLSPKDEQQYQGPSVGPEDFGPEPQGGMHEEIPF